MPGTRRTPLFRQATPQQLTPRAIKLFVELERARRARKHVDDCTVTKHGLCTGDCAACLKWDDLHDQIHRELKLRPWEWPCLPYCPYPPNSPAAMAWRPGGSQRALYEVLDEARRHTN
jgi:hypothetical protein